MTTMIWCRSISSNIPSTHFTSYEKKTLWKIYYPNIKEYLKNKPIGRRRLYISSFALSYFTKGYFIYKLNVLSVMPHWTKIEKEDLLCTIRLVYLVFNYLSWRVPPNWVYIMDWWMAKDVSFCLLLLRFKSLPSCPFHIFGAWISLVSLEVHPL